MDALGGLNLKDYGGGRKIKNSLSMWIHKKDIATLQRGFIFSEKEE